MSTDNEIGIGQHSSTTPVPVVDSDETIIPISEWPIVEGGENEVARGHTSTGLGNTMVKQNVVMPQKRLSLSSSISIRKEDMRNVKKKQKFHSDSDPCRDQDLPGGDDAINEPTITAKIARWWRQKRLHGICRDIPKCDPKSMIHHISRLPECRSFLQKERTQLLRILGLHSVKVKASTYAALASIEDYLADFPSALNYIEQAVTLEPINAEYLWLREKLFKQCQVIKEQTDAMKKIDDNRLILPTMEQVPRISGRSLSVSDFQIKFLRKGKPVIITDVVPDLTDRPFDYSLVLEHAGKTRVTTKEAVPDSLTWAKLESKRETTVAELIQGTQDGTVKDVLFDWSLPIHCPGLAKKISLPDYFKNNFLLQTSPGSLYRESWPSLFIAPKGATTQLHIDAFHSHFWMALFQGEKRWTFFDEQDTAFLYPQWFQSTDPVFEVDLTEPDVSQFPLFTLTHPQQCVLHQGELLFVPAGSPHFVENLTPTLAISSNYVDHSNFKKACEELKINSFQDQRASDLLSQLQDPVFLQKVESF